MTTIYDTYYPLIDRGKIDLSDVNMSVLVCDITYIPLASHQKKDVTGIIKTFPQLLTGSAVSTLTMGEIIDKILAKLRLLEPEYLENAFWFVVYDIATQQLCFSDQLK